MSVIEPDGGDILDSGRVLYTPAGGGDVRWMAGDAYRILASREDGTGAIGMVEATVPIGAGPGPHVHARTDEGFYLVSGTIAFLGGEKTVTAEPGAFLHVPRGTLHRFMNVGDEEARLLFFLNPAGPELLFKHAGDRGPEQWTPQRRDAAIAAVAHLDVDLTAHPELDHLFQPERGRGIR